MSAVNWPTDPDADPYIVFTSEWDHDYHDVEGGSTYGGKRRRWRFWSDGRVDTQGQRWYKPTGEWFTRRTDLQLHRVDGTITTYRGDHLSWDGMDARRFSAGDVKNAQEGDQFHGAVWDNNTVRGDPGFVHFYSVGEAFSQEWALANDPNRRIHTGLITLCGRETLLLAVLPDWSTPVVSAIQIEADIAEGVTGIQERRADSLAPRVRMRYRASLGDAQLQVLRSVLAGLDGRPVAIPFWPDWLNTVEGEDGTEETDIQTRALMGQVNAGWNGRFSDVEVTTGGALPDRAFCGALLVGRLAPSTLKAITDGLAELDIAFVEDSPWECSAVPAQTDPGAWDPTWAINWAALPEQSQRLLVDYANLGRGRRSVSEGTADAHFWRQVAGVTLGRPGIAQLLAFYCARGGGVEAFALPSALQPGAATPTAPHQFDASNGRVRFSRGELRFEWVTPTLADARIVVEQQKETPSVDQEPASFAFLYRFHYAGETLELTDWEEPQSADAATWKPARIEHGRIRQSLKPQNEECEITASLEDVPLLEPLLRLELETPARVDIFERELPTGEPQMLFTGMIEKARANGERVRLTAAAFGGALARRVPRFQWSITCNHTLFSHGCARRRPLAMVPSNFMASAQFEDQWSDPKLILKEVQYPGTPPPHHYYAGGWVETGTGSNRQVREILESWTLSAEGQLHLLLARPIRTEELEAGQLFQIYPGCDGKYSTCGSKFGNSENFGGFPFMPAWIEQAPAGAPPKTGK